MHIPADSLFRDNRVLFAAPIKDEGIRNVTYAWSDV